MDPLTSLRFNFTLVARAFLALGSARRRPCPAGLIQGLFPSCLLSLDGFQDTWTWQLASLTVELALTLLQAMHFHLEHLLFQMESSLKV